MPTAEHTSRAVLIAEAEKALYPELLHPSALTERPAARLLQRVVKRPVVHHSSNACAPR